MGASAVVGAYLGGLLLSWAAEWAWPALRPPASPAYAVPPLALLAACLATLRWTGGRPDVSWPGVRWVILSVAAGAVLKFAADGLVLLERPLLGPLRGNNPLVLHPQAFAHPAAVGVLAAAVVLLVPAAEELFFRGLLYGWLRTRWGATAATLIAAVLFAAAHGSVGLVLPLTLVGAGLCVLYERGRSLWPPVLAHVTVNALSLAFALPG